MKRLLLAIVVAAIAGASCVRHVELTHGAVDAPARPDASVDASTIDASFAPADAAPADAAPDSSIDAL